MITIGNNQFIPMRIEIIRNGTIGIGNIHFISKGIIKIRN